MTTTGPRNAAGPHDEEGPSKRSRVIETFCQRGIEASLTPFEQELFTTLREASKALQMGTVMRVAGGWVRDKLLGLDSDDIDISLDNMSGVAFAERLNQFLKEQGEERHAIHVIQQNPEQSKHLETARLKYKDRWIDLVNLRSETYATSSRIPEMHFGTPLEDALRRDITINSLFYNINERTVEDLTGQGIADLRAGLVRTPLAPLTTFLDDPLRVLRAIRFAARFLFRLDVDLCEAAQHPEVRAALFTKISRERIGTEVEGMLRGAHPVVAFRDLHRLGLLPVLCSCPKERDDLMTGKQGDAAFACLQRVHHLLSLRESVDANEARLALLAALLLPVRGMKYPLRKKNVPLSRLILLEGLKHSAKDADAVELLHESAKQFERLLRSDENPATLTRVNVGLAVRNAGPMWLTGLDLAVLTILCDMPDAEKEEQCIVERGKALAHRVMDEFGLNGIWNEKPILNGKEVMELLQIREGRVIASILNDVLRWQLEHPSASKDACMAWLCARHQSA